jgi:hypothetical protein
MNSVVVWLLVSFVSTSSSSQLLLGKAPTEQACEDAKAAYIAAATKSGARMSNLTVSCSRAEVIVEDSFTSNGGSTYSRKENK